MLKENSGWNWLPDGSELGQHICRCVIVPSDVLDFVSEEALGDLINFVSVSRHDGVPGVLGSGYLLCHQVGVSTAYDVLDPEFLCDARFM
jgi:hypothetical protein